MDKFWGWFNRGVVGHTLEPLQVAVDQWLASHWWINFLVTHPLALTGVVLLTIFLISGALRAISRTSESLWILTLKLPLRVLGWLGVQSWAWWRKRRRDEAGDRLQELLTRLETLRAEQDAIIAEVKTLVQNNPQSKAVTQPLQPTTTQNGHPQSPSNLLSQPPAKS